MKIILGIFILFTSINSNADTFKFCGEDWEPYLFEKDGKYIGSTIDALDMALKEQGHTLQFEKVVSVERCNNMVKAGEVDGSLFSAKGEAKGTEIFVNTPIEYWVVSAIVQGESKLTSYSSLEQFDDLIVGVVKGYEYPEVIMKHKFKKTDMITSSEQNLVKLSGKRIEVIFDDPVWALAIKKNKSLNLKVLSPPITYESTHVVFTKIHSATVNKTNDIFKRFIIDGTMDKLYKKYTGITFSEFKKENLK